MDEDMSVCTQLELRYATYIQPCRTCRATLFTISPSLDGSIILGELPAQCLYAVDNIFEGRLGLITQLIGCRLFFIRCPLQRSSGILQLYTKAINILRWVAREACNLLDQGQ